MLKNYKELKAYGSNCGLETQILLSGDLDHIKDNEIMELLEKIGEVERMLKAFIRSLKDKPSNP
jgi:four helix bundle protein